MSEQYGFYFNADRCVRCHACELACKSLHGTEPGIYWRKVTESWSGHFPDLRRTFFSMSCMHCAEPACASVCPADAISKRTSDGIVVVDRDLCNGCRECLDACPFDIPQFGADGMMQKCDFCLERESGPACAEFCPSGALSFGPMEKLLAQTGSARRYEGTTGPSLVISDRPARRGITS